MKKKMGIVLCAICMMTALFSSGIVYAADEGTESPQEPAVVETYADPGEKTVVVENQEDLHNAIDQANALGATAFAAGKEMDPFIIELSDDIYVKDADIPGAFSYMFAIQKGTNVTIDGNGHTIQPDDSYVVGTKYYMFQLNGAELTLQDIKADMKGRADYQGAFLLARYDEKSSHFIVNEGTEITGGYGAGVAAVIIKDSRMTMNGGKIYGNHNEHYLIGGGAVCLNGEQHADAYFVMNGGELCDNFNGGMGGAISTIHSLAGYRNHIIINGGKIHDNTALGAGAINARNADLEIYDAEIYGNTATKDVTEFDMVGGEGGGAVTVASDSIGVIDGASIHDNYSDLSGGAIQVFSNSQLTIRNGEIYNNIAESHGGAICVADAFSSRQESKSVLTIEHAILRDNVARSTFAEEGHSSAPHSPGGGAIYAHEFCEVYLKDGAQLLNNRTISTGNGGAVYICFGGLLQMDGGIIENNTSANHGGAVYLEGADSYAGVDHVTMPDDGYGEGSLMRMNDGRIRNNHAHGNGGGIYAEGDNRVEETWYRGGACLMNGGVITGNQADLQGGGVYLESEAEGVRSSSFHMNDGALYFNVAGEDGNTSSAADMAGAELYSEGGNTHFSVRSAEEITSYLHDEENRYVPQEDRAVWFDSWYDDYSDQDEMYGKQEERIGSGTHSGRYMSSQTIDRMAYAPQSNTNAYKALILDRSTTLTIAKTVSGEGIREETYTFTIEAETPAEGGEKYPVAYEGDTENEAIGTLSDGRSYIRLEEGTATIRLKAGEQLTIGSLPVGCKVTVTEVDAGAAKDTAITVSGTEEEATIDEGRRSATVTTITKWENAKEEVQTQVRIENVYEKDPEEPIPPVDDPKEPGDEPNTSETETPDRPKTDAVVLSSLLFGMALLSGSIVIVLKKKKALR